MPTHPVDELHPKRPDGEYSLSKLIGEDLALMASRETGLQISIVRPSHVLSGTKIFDQFTVSRVCNILKKSQSKPGTELYMEDGTELWHQIEDAAKNQNQPCSVCDLEGRPWYYQPNDARDIEHCIVCSLESPSAIGESFNGGSPFPFTFPEGAKLLAEITNQDLLEISLPVRWCYDHDITKAKTLIDYKPKGNLKAMMDSAIACKMGKTDYT